MKLSELAILLGSSVAAAKEDFEVTGISTLEEASPTDVSFISDQKYMSGIKDTRAGAVLVSEKLAPVEIPHIPLADVWAGTLTTLKHFFPGFERRSYQGIHPSAIVDKTARLGENVTVAPLVVIGPGAIIGDGTYIGPGAVIGATCRLGANCTVYANAVLESETRLGNGVYVQPGAVIGADGFKYELLNGRWTKIPQVGHVELGDDVEVGANTCIDRASYTVTSVGPNTKVDNLVQIAHNVKVGQNGVIVSQTGIAGSSTVGDNCIVAAQAGIADNVTVGNQVIVLARAAVKDDVKDGQKMFGAPAQTFREEARLIGLQHRLPELFAEVTRLTKRVAELEQALSDREKES